MTTKWKIILGFVVMVMLTGIVVLQGYVALQRSSDGFTEYRRLSMLNTGTSELEARMNKATAHVYHFLVNNDPQRIAEARQEADRFTAQADDLYQYAASDERRHYLDSIKGDMALFTAASGKVVESVNETHKQYEEVVVKNAWAMIELLSDMGDRAALVGNTQAAQEVTKMWKQLVPLLSRLGRFANSYAEDDAKMAETYLAGMGGQVESFGRVVSSEQGLKDYAAIKEAYKHMHEAFLVMRASCESLRNNSLSLGNIIETMTGKAGSESEALNGRMVKNGEETLASNNSGQRTMMMIAGGGLIIGLLTAFFITIGLIRVLRQLAVYADAVAGGDFNSRIGIREKGEVGGMIESLRRIPAVLDQIINSADAMAGNIRKGFLRERLDTSAFSGSFIRLGDAVNTVSGAYADLLDVLPLPVHACDRGHKIIYLNKAGQSVAGGTRLGEESKEVLGITGIPAQDVPGARAMESKAVYRREITLHPQGKRMEAAVTAIPTYDAAASVSGYIEMLLDLTEIKDKQAVMLNVARDASDIADRVAAASEELAAQVEEISRGAEVQRRRVESTASAMSEMNATVIEVARNASQASEQSENTRGQAEGGAKLVNQVVDSINRINAVGQKMQGNMHELGSKAESVGGVMNVISDIADQTNLLALNAAIEAARAGEAGRGFAVVADEVRKLAEKTMAATHEVGANITAIQQSAKVNIEEVETAVAGVTEATTLANSSGEALREIVQLASLNSSIVASIATAAEEQSATSEEINSAIDEINRITADTTDGMIQSSEAVQELSRMAQELKRVMEGLR